MPAYDEQEYTQSFNLRTWKSLGPYLRPRRREFLLLVCMNLLTALVDELIAGMGTVVDKTTKHYPKLQNLKENRHLVIDAIKKR